VFHVLAGLPFGAGIFLLPLLFVLQLAMNLGIALLTTTATIFVRDMQNVVGYILRVLFFLTPVIYPVSALNQVGPFLQTVIWINPLFPLFAAYQACLTGGVPTAGQVFATIAWTLFYLVLGYRVFVTHERAFAIRL
jgi:ABC-type polysaccharide/polyol phosphate export permease